MPVQRNADGVIVNADDLTVDDVVGDRVLCPARGDKIFEHWPFGWDAHSAHQCDGVAGATEEDRKDAFKGRFRHLFRFRGVPMNETCAICGCQLHRDGEYALPTVLGRSHATSHHYVAERFFGRSTNRRGTQREAIFDTCPWGHEGETVVFCYECHEELLHNPVILPEDIQRFARLVRLRGFAEQTKGEGRSLIGGRVRLFQEIIAKGIEVLLAAEEGKAAASQSLQPTGPAISASENS